MGFPMRTKRALVLPVVAGLVLLGVGLSASAFADEWKEYSSQEGRLAVDFPGTPQQAKQPMQTKVGTLVARIAMQSPSNNVFYGVLYLDYPKSTLEKYSADDLLDGSRDSAVKRVKGGRLVGEDKISLAGNPGRQFKVDAPGDVHMTVRVYLVMNRLYWLIASVKDADKDADPKRFFDSFKLANG